MERILIDDTAQHNAAVSPLTEPDADCFTPELIAARLRAFEELQALLQKGTSTSGRNGRPWNEYLNEGREL